MRHASFAATLVLLPFTVAAQSPNAAAAYAQGLAAVQRQDFDAALTAFEAALAARMQGPAVHYNIGVAAYRTKRYDRATRAFEEVARTPAMAALAHYNLGLIAKAQGDATTARHQFERVLAETEDERLKSLAQASLDGFAPSAPTFRRTWAAFAAAGIGYDDNVTLTANGQVLGVRRESDVYADALAAGSMQLTNAWRIDADAAHLQYADLDEFDQFGAGVGARYRFDLVAWPTYLGAHLGTTYIDGDRFDLRHSLFVQTSHELSSVWSARARYRLSLIDGGEGYEAFDGLRHELATRFTYTAASWVANGAYIFELGDYDSASLSGTRNQILFDVRKPLAPAWTATAAIGFRNSDYDDGGRERRFELSAGAELALSERWTVVLQYLHTDTDADAAELSYERNRILLGVEATLR